jgi:hypothetical protein
MDADMREIFGLEDPELMALPTPVTQSAPPSPPSPFAAPKLRVLKSNTNTTAQSDSNTRAKPMKLQPVKLQPVKTVKPNSNTHVKLETDQILCGPQMKSGNSKLPGNSNSNTVNTKRSKASSGSSSGRSSNTGRSKSKKDGLSSSNTNTNRGKIPAKNPESNRPTSSKPPGIPKLGVVSGTAEKRVAKSIHCQQVKPKSLQCQPGMPGTFSSSLFPPILVPDVSASSAHNNNHNGNSISGISSNTRSVYGTGARDDYRGQLLSGGNYFEKEV